MAMGAHELVSRTAQLKPFSFHTARHQLLGQFCSSCHQAVSCCDCRIHRNICRTLFSVVLYLSESGLRACQKARRTCANEQWSHVSFSHISQKLPGPENPRVTSSVVSRCWLFTRHTDAVVLAVTVALEAVWNITVLQLLSHGDTRFAISIVRLLNPSMVMSFWLPEAGKSSTVMIVDTSLEIHRTASASAGHLHREDHRHFPNTSIRSEIQQQQTR